MLVSTLASGLMTVAVIWSIVLLCRRKWAQGLVVLVGGGILFAAIGLPLGNALRNEELGKLFGSAVWFALALVMDKRMGKGVK